MYLAPLNYDRYFKKVFSDLTIARHFLEDFLDVRIEKIEHLERRKAVTDDARYVEFDFRCRIEGAYVVIEMQQWYKPDVVQRFYVYHALNTALQLEGAPTKSILAGDDARSRTTDYRAIMPVVTLVWLVEDNLGFEDDQVAFVPTPEQIPAFIRDVRLWRNPDVQALVRRRGELLAQLEKDEKDLPWLYQNRLIYAFQKNIVRNKKYERYYAWFDLAQKTLDKVEDRREYEAYERDERFSEVVRRLRTEAVDPLQLEYIEDYDRFRAEVLRYDEGIRAAALREGLSKGRREASEEFLPQIEEREKALQAEREKAEAERQKAQAERERAEAERQKADAERQKADAERERAEAERQKAQAEREKTVRLLRELGLTDQEIARRLGLGPDEVAAIA